MKRKRRFVKMKGTKSTAGNTLFHRHPWILYPVITMASLFLIAVILITILSRNLPSLTELEQYDPQLVTRIYSSDKDELGNYKILDELAMQNRIQVPFEQIPSHLIEAVLAIEDRRFYRHWGLDIRRIAKAALIDIITLSKAEGASTITQQLARNLYLSPEKLWTRKLREQLTSLQIERTYSKNEILEMYMNHNYFGHGAYGVQAAAQRYFKKNVEDLKIEESALLAGLIQLPAPYSPINHPEAAKRRRNIVFYSMLECGYLTRTEFDSLKQMDIILPEGEKGRKTIAPYFCEYIRQMLYEKYGEKIYTGGYSIYTTLDTRVQACADSAITAFIPTMDEKILERLLNEDSFAQFVEPPLESEKDIEAFKADTARFRAFIDGKSTVQTALVCLDPTTGHILSMVGGRDFEKSEWNRATQMRRQPGSSFKPIVYTVAIDNGYPPTTELLNQPVVLIMHDGSRWDPPNFDGSTGGLTTLREGIYRSLNLISVRLVQQVIPKEEVVTYARRFGFTTPIEPVDAIALGTEEVIPLELTSAFSVLANRGVRVEPVAVLRVEDKDGNILEEAIPRRRDVINEKTAYIMTSMLQDVILHSRGTGHAATWRYHFYRPSAGKTGTTNDYRNTWFVGFTPQISAGVWVGLDDERISLGDKQTGATTALPIWAPFMRMAHDTLGLPPVEFVMPPGVVRVKICGETKKIATDGCPDVWEEVFTEEMAPTDTCDVHLAPSRHDTRRTRHNRGIY
jgi:penicillin-binding protein 1A